MADVIHRIDLGVNCYLVGIDSGYALVDTGFPRKQAALDAALEAAGCQTGDLRLIVLTHGDVDHVGNCAHLRAVHRATIAIHAADAEMVRTGNMGLGRKDKPDSAALVFRFVVWAVGLLNKIRGPGAQYEPFEPDILLEDGCDLSAQGLNARVVSLPGHSKGSVGFLTENGDLFCGDLLVNILRPGLHFYIDDKKAALDSVRRLRELDVKTIYPGHGKPFALEELKA